MKKTIPVIILFVLSSLVYCQKTLNIDMTINGDRQSGSIKNISHYIDNGRVIINYDLTGPKTYNIEVKRTNMLSGLDQYVPAFSEEVELKLPKLKKVGSGKSPKIKLPKLKKV